MNTAKRLIRWLDELFSTADTTLAIAVYLNDEFGIAKDSAGQCFTIPEDEHADGKTGSSRSYGRNREIERTHKFTGDDWNFPDTLSGGLHHAESKAIWAPQDFIRHGAIAIAGHWASKRV